MVSQDFMVTPIGGVHLVFGLDWYVILETQVSQAAQRLARRHKASYWVVSDQVNSAAGLLFHKLLRSQTMVYVAAALLFTHHFPHGTHALILPLDTGQWWLLAWHDGAVIRDTDQLYASEALAQAALAQLRPAYPGLQVRAAHHYPAWEQLISETTERIRLRPVPRMNTRTWLMGAGLTALFAGVGLLTWHGLSRGADAPSAPETLSQATVEQAWEHALHQMLAQHSVHGTATTKHALQQLYDLPLMLGGWELVQAQCQAQTRYWACVADFQRARPDASNESLLQHQPDRWALQFTPLKQAQARWTIPASSHALTDVSVASARHNERELFSDLQRLMLGFRALTISRPSELTPKAPVDAQGQSYPPPSDLPTYQTRKIHVRAPLRTISVLLPHVAHIRWERIQIQLGSAVVPALLQSGVTATLEGVLYEIQ